MAMALITPACEASRYESWLHPCPLPAPSSLVPVRLRLCRWPTVDRREPIGPGRRAWGGHVHGRVDPESSILRILLYITWYPFGSNPTPTDTEHSVGTVPSRTTAGPRCNCISDSTSHRLSSYWPRGSPTKLGVSPPVSLSPYTTYSVRRFPLDLTPPPSFFRARFLIDDQNLSNPLGHDHQLQRHPYSHSVAVAAKNRLGSPLPPQYILH